MPHLFASYVKASPRSGRQHKACGASPRFANYKTRISPRSGLIIYFALVLGLEKLPTEEVKETEAAILKRSDGQFCLFT